MHWKRWKTRGSTQGKFIYRNPLKPKKRSGLDFRRLCNRTFYLVNDFDWKIKKLLRNANTSNTLKVWGLEQSVILWKKRIRQEHLFPIIQFMLNSMSVKGNLWACVRYLKIIIVTKIFSFLPAQTRFRKVQLEKLCLQRTICEQTQIRFLQVDAILQIKN